MKGRIALVFWLVVVLAVLTATASYAWLAMNLSAGVRGIELGVESDSLYIEISADAKTGYGKDVYFERVLYSDVQAQEEISLVTCDRLPEYGAVRIADDRITSGKYDGSGKYYKAVKSDITGGDDSYIDITSTLEVGDSLIGYYSVQEESAHSESNNADCFYYYKSARTDGAIDYVCIGKIPIGEKLANRLFWGYAYSDSLDEAQSKNTLNIVSLDIPRPEYAIKNTVYIRCAAGTGDAKDLSIASVEVKGIRNYLTDAIRIMFDVRSDDGESVTAFYSHRERESFDGTLLLSEIYGNELETVTVDIYIYFDGTDESAYKQDGILTRNIVNVTFTVDDHDYN